MLLFFSFLLPSSEALDVNNLSESYFTVDKVKITREYEELTLDFSLYSTKNDCSDFSLWSVTDIPEFSLDDIINVGEKVWKMIEANKPVVNVDMPVAHAMPKGVQCWADLERWQTPKSYMYRVEYQNLYGYTVVTFHFRLSYVYGGSLNGKGLYLANVAVVPATLDVAWGYKFDASTIIGQTVNLGTKEDPEAGISLGVKWRIRTLMKDSDNTENFFIRANGELQQL